MVIGCQPCASLDPDTAVAEGATLLTGLLYSNQLKDSISDISQIVTSLTACSAVVKAADRDKIDILFSKGQPLTSSYQCVKRHYYTT